MRKRILTGDRTTGRLHLGHFAGSLQNRVKLQNEYETLVLLADVQALTTHFSSPELIGRSILDVLLDNLSVGLDPDKVVFIQQSHVPSIAELTVFLSMLVSVNALRHNPTVKTEAKQYGFDELSYGFLGYPVSQAADIAFCGAQLVPVGEDQLPHMEQARKLIRRFNELYGGGEDVLLVPETLLSSTPRLMGLDGSAKMGKSLGNALFLSDDAETVSAKVRGAKTDTGRIAVSDKGNPEVCAVSAYHKAFNQGEYENISCMCRQATIGCVACKKQLSAQLNILLDPVRERRAYYKKHMDYVKGVLYSGTKKAVRIGEETLQRVKGAMGLSV